MTTTGKVLLLVLAAFGMLAAQPRTVVFEFEPVMVDTSVTKVVASLLRDRMADTKAFTVVTPPAGAEAYSVAAAESIARTLGVQQALMGSITRVGTKLLIAYKLLVVPSGEVASSDRVTVESESDLDIVTERLAAALKAGKPYAATPQAGRATAAELKMREPASSILFSTGYTFPIYHRLGYDPGTMFFTLEAAVTYEMPQFLVMGQMGLIRGKQGFQDVHFELTGHKLFGGTDVTPYVGGGIGVHRIQLRPDYPLPQHEDDGLALVASGGVMLFRSSYFRVIGGAKATAVFTQDIGPLFMAGFSFGITSPGFDPGGKYRTPPACIYGTLGAFLITGLIVALAT
jgi:hypothetical protein